MKKTQSAEEAAFIERMTRQTRLRDQIMAWLDRFVEANQYAPLRLWVREYPQGEEDLYIGPCVIRGRKISFPRTYVYARANRLATSKQEVLG